jgi:hypothetical protein
MKKHITTLRHNFARFQLHSGDENPNNLVVIDTTTNKVFKVVDILEKYLSNDDDLWDVFKLEGGV